MNTSFGTLEIIPPIDLYMDQVLTLLNGQNFLVGEKKLTKAMINNYSKEGLITPVKGKKYNMDQLFQIAFICIMKQSLSMNRIKEVMGVLNKEDINWREFYAQFLQIQNNNLPILDEVLNNMNSGQELLIKDKALLVLVLCNSVAYLSQLADNIVEKEFTLPTKAKAEKTT